MRIFVVDDDAFYAEFLKYHLALNPSNEVVTFNDGNSLLKRLKDKPDLITLDYTLPDIHGETLFEKIKKELPDVPVVIVSGQEEVSTALSMIREGVYDYVVKDDNTKERLWDISQSLKQEKPASSIKATSPPETSRKASESRGHMMKGESPAMQEVFKMINKAASTTITVSVSGETGTGKELVAKSIHAQSERKNKPFVAVNVTAIPKDLIESELFGHEKGAFTGAHQKRIGKFEEASGGTLFLDEIGEMDMSLQSKLLRVLQEREITRVGGNQTIQVDVRLVVATHKTLSDEVQKGNFREDLYYRLLGFPINLPPLRERDGDVILLARHFLESFARDNQLPEKKLSSGATNKLVSYRFPGNIRELKAVVELAYVMSNEDFIQAEDISFSSGVSMSDLMQEEKTLKEYNQRIIEYFLDKYDNNVLLVAKKLDIGKSTIYRMLKSGDLARPEVRQYT